MTDDLFWELIDKSRLGAVDFEAQAVNLTESLQRMPAGEIVEFERRLGERLAEAYRWDLWAVASIVNEGCSEDEFEAFRAWLVAQGRESFEAALEDPARAADEADPGGYHSGEDLLAVATAAYERVARDEMPAVEIEAPDEPIGVEWKEEELPTLFPELWARFGPGPS